MDPTKLGRLDNPTRSLGRRHRRDENSDQVLDWAEDFPTETAGYAVATLARESILKHCRSGGGSARR